MKQRKTPAFADVLLRGLTLFDPLSQDRQAAVPPKTYLECFGSISRILSVFALICITHHDSPPTLIFSHKTFVKDALITVCVDTRRHGVCVFIT